MILFIDTTTSYPVVAVSDGCNIKDIYNSKIDSDISVSIFSIIDNMFKKLNITPKDIKTIMVSNGPGSFTGTRIGVTIAKVYGYSFNIKVIPVSSLEVLATTKVDYDYIVPIIDARRGYVFGGIYDNELNSILNDSYISLEELNSHLADKSFIYVSNDNFEFNVLKPAIDLMKVVNKHIKDEGINPHKLNPNYLKKTEAEEKLNDRNSN